MFKTRVINLGKLSFIAKFVIDLHWSFLFFLTSYMFQPWPGIFRPRDSKVEIHPILTQNVSMDLDLDASH